MVRFSKRDFDIATKVVSGRTLQDVGDEYRVSRERIRQITDKVKKHTLIYIEKNGNDFEPAVARSLRDKSYGTTASRDVDDVWLHFMKRFQSSRIDAMI